MEEHEPKRFTQFQFRTSETPDGGQRKLKILSGQFRIVGTPGKNNPDRIRICSYQPRERKEKTISIPQVKIVFQTFRKKHILLPKCILCQMSTNKKQENGVHSSLAFSLLTSFFCPISVPFPLTLFPLLLILLFHLILFSPHSLLS